MELRFRRVVLLSLRDEGKPLVEERFELLRGEGGDIAEFRADEFLEISL